MPTPILFLDFDKTLCFDNYWRSLPTDQYTAVQDFIFGGKNTYIHDWMIGKYTAEDINKLVSEKIGIEYDVLWKLFVSDCMTMKVSHEVLKKIDALRSTYVTILITANMDSFSRFTVPALGLEKYFDYINNSFFEGKHKYDNGGEVMKRYIQELNAPLSECVLIDDSARNCEIFVGLGGRACQVVPGKDVGYYLDTLK